MSSETKRLPLADEMRKATRVAHKLSDAVVLSKLLTVLTDKVVYARAISCFYPVYAALEAKVAKHRALPALAPVAAVYDKVARSGALEADLEFLLGPAWRQQAVRTPAVERYLEHLDKLEGEDPSLLLGYCYGLHFVALFGPLGRRIRSALDLPGPDGVRFYSCEGGGPLLRELKAAMNAAGETLSPETRAKVIQEGINMYTFNNAVVSAFSPGWQAYAKAPLALLQSLPTWLTAGGAAAAAALAYWRMRA